MHCQGRQLPATVGVELPGGPTDFGFALTYQNLLFCRVPINSILGFIIRTYKKVGFALVSRQ